MRTCGAPDVEEVVVAARGELGAAGGPLQATHLLLMAPQHPCDVLPDPATQGATKSASLHASYQVSIPLHADCCAYGAI